MMTFLEKLIDISPYKSRTEREKALFVYSVVGIALILGTFYFFVIPDTGEGGTLTYLQAALNGEGNALFTTIVFYILLIATYIGTRLGHLKFSAIGIPTLVYQIGVLPVILGSQNTVQASIPVLYAIMIMAGGLLYQERGAMITLLISIMSTWLFHSAELFDRVPIITLLLIAYTGILYAYLRYVEISRIEGAEQATAERLKMADITTRISSLTLERIEINEVLKQGLDLIQKGYPKFYHAQVFLLDETGRNAQLVSSTGEAGRVLIQKQHSIGVGSQSVIGQATLRNIHVITNANEPNTIHKKNEFLPDTVIEAAFPLRVGNQVIGALDLQSKLDLKLEEDEIFTYQSLANSFALAIDNVRQFQVAEERIKDNQQLAQQARQALKEVDRLNKRLMEQAWSEYMTEQSKQTGLNVNFENNTVEENDSWSESLQQAINNGDIVQSFDETQTQFITVPLKVRGQIIGAMEFELDKDHNIDPTDLTLISEVSERFGLAAENTRLVEESQWVAQREALVNEIGSRLQSTNNIESTLTEAVRSLGNVMNANRISIKLKNPNENNNNNGIQ